MSKELTVGEIDKELGLTVPEGFPPVTGIEEREQRAGYPYLLLLKDLKTASDFSDAKNIAISALGKYFIKSNNGNHSADFMDKVKGTLIKEQFGYEMWIDGKQVEAGKGSLSKEQKQQLIEAYGVEGEKNKKKHPANVIKILIKLEQPWRLRNGEIKTFVAFTVKGSTYMAYIEQVLNARKKIMLNDTELQKMYQTNDHQRVHATWWELEMTSEFVKGTNADGQSVEYWQPVFTVTKNGIDKARALAADIVTADEFDLIRMRPINSEPVEAGDEEVTADEVVSDGEVSPNEAMDQIEAMNTK